MPGREALRPFVTVDTLRVLVHPGGLQYARQTWDRLAGAEPPPSSMDEQVVVGRINTLCGSFPDPRYLEIGVFLGQTFLNVAAGHKVGVDPKPRFTVPPSLSHSCALFCGTSDAYFAANKGEEFDVIFLDGLHTYQQTWWDFLNSIGYAHDRTYWLIDDIVPVSEFAALPDESEARRAAQAAGRPGDGRWQGDVYKTVAAIARTFPEFAFSTLVGGGKEQLLVWLPEGHSLPRVTPQTWGLAVDESYATVFGDGAIPRSFNPRSDEAALQAALDRLPVAGTSA